MKKKIIIALLILIIPASVFAAAFDFSIGGVAQYDFDYETFKADDLADFSNYKFGADMRVKLFAFELDATAMFSQQASGSDVIQISTLPTAGLSFDLGSIARIGVGIGPNLKFYVGGGAENIDVLDMVKNSNLAYRATVDFMVGHVMFGASYTVDTKNTFNSFDMQSMVPDFTKGIVGVSVLFSI